MYFIRRDVNAYIPGSSGRRTLRSNKEGVVFYEKTEHVSQV